MKDREISSFQSLFDIIYKRRSIEFAYSEEMKLKIISDKYNVAISINGTLEQYSNRLSKTINDCIKKIAIYKISDVEANKDNTHNVKKEVAKGNWFSKEVLFNLLRQLYLESKLTDNSKAIPANILSLLAAHTENGSYYIFDETTILAIFDYAIDLFLVSGNKYPAEKTLNNYVSLILSIKIFRLKLSDDYELKNGKFLLNDTASRRIHRNIEEIVKRVGGINLLKRIFERIFEPKYDSQLDRYIIHRNKSLLPLENNDGMPIPYQYLIQLSLKHLQSNLNNTQMSLLIKELIEKSKAYISLLQIYDLSPMSDLMIDFEDIPKYITDNIVFETLCIPQQYAPSFVYLLISKLYLPSLKNSNGYPDFYKPCYMLNLIKATLEYPPGSIITEKSLFAKTNIEEKIIREFLSHFSQEANVVNYEFNMILEKTNTQEYPLINLGNGVFFLLSPHLCGYAFCVRIYKIIKTKYYKDKQPFDRYLGDAIEDFTKQLLDEKGYSYKCGKYVVDTSNEDGECDMVVETNKKILFIELKKRSLPEAFEITDGIEIFRSLKEGMLKAQIQAFKHRLHLKEHGQINLNGESIIQGNKSVHSISICLPEYAFLTTKFIALKLTESLIFVSYEASDAIKKQQLEGLNELAEKFRILVNKYANGTKIDSRQLLFNTSFRSLQQLWVALNNSCSIEDFVKNLTCDSHVVYSSFDYYSSLQQTFLLENVK